LQRELFASCLGKFCNIDGNNGRTALPFPHNPTHNKVEYQKWEKLSARDRLKQVESHLSEDEVKAHE
jgi:hypothetical protein